MSEQTNELGLLLWQLLYYQKKVEEFQQKLDKKVQSMKEDLTDDKSIQ